MNYCPICANLNYKHMETICTNLKIMGKSFCNGYVNLVVCRNCGCVYLQSENSEKVYLDYYTSDYSKAPKYYEMFEKRDVDEYFEHIYTLLSSLIKGKCRILDFGGSWGELAEYIEKRNEDWKVDVLDPNEKCIQSAKKRGLDVVCASSVDFFEKELAKYDVIVLNHIAEHICNLKETMINLKPNLKDEGFIFFEIPDAEGYVKEIAPPYMYLTYEHVVHMSDLDVENLAAVTGYKVCSMHKYYKKVSNYPSLCAILKPIESINDDVTNSNTENYVRAYIDKSFNEIKQAICKLSKISDKFILWGIGASTTILLEAFGDQRIFMLVDGNPSKQGIVYKVGQHNYTIEAPHDITTEEVPILILSYAYKNSIRKSIESIGLNNQIYSLDEELNK